MANKRISSLDDITLVGGTSTPGLTASDIIPVTDIDDTTGSLQGTTKKVTVANLVAVAPQGDLESANNLSDLADAATARTNLGVDAAGTDNSTDVTLAAVANNYLTLSGQEITAGIVPVSLGGTGSGDLATARANLGLGSAATTASSDYATAAQGTTADSAVQPTDGIEVLSNVSISNPADGSILKYVSANSQYEEASLGTASTADSSDFATAAQGALADTAQQPPAEGAFVDGDKTKLDDIEAGADVTDATNVEAAGALMDSEVTNLAEVKAFSSADYATASHTHAIDDLSDVTITSASNEDVIKWNGSSFVNGQVSVDVDTPLNTALRGTTNPHIGAYPNQSFKVIDNPYQSVMVVADEAGNLKLLNSLGVNNIAVGFSVVEDGVEPDIEVVSGSETYSVISGDSDTKGANGLPTRQGFNLPDIGANPAPILISGGSIA
jgi:hypothetical protein